MSRSNYSDDYDDDLAAGRYRGMVASATRGKRGQRFFHELVDALETMPEKRLIVGELRKDGEVCAIGALGAKRGVSLEEIDPDDVGTVAFTFNIAECLAREIVYMNDEFFYRLTPEKRYEKMLKWSREQIKQTELGASDQ